MNRSRAGETSGAWLLAVSLLVSTGVREVDGLTAESISVTIAARAIQPGELVVFTITTPDNATAVSVRAFDRETRAARRDGATWIALVGIDLNVAAGRFDATITAHTRDGSVSASHALTVEPKQFPTRRLTVNPALVEPPASALPRIKREVALTNGIYRSPASTVLWNGPFVRPVDDPANSRFGTRSIFNGRRGSPHNGADFLSPTGTPIKAPNAGRVRLAEDLYFSGNTVIVDHGLGLFSLFAHLSALQVKEGDVVSTGEVLGLVGATGRVTGPHLHWTVRATGARVDPLSLLSVLGHEATVGSLPAGPADPRDRAPAPR